MRDEPIYAAFRDEKVTHFCGAPIVLNMLANAPDQLKDFDHEIKVMTAGAPPPAAVIEKMEGMGVEVTHVYGLTETYGPSVVCAWKDEWNTKAAEERAALKVRQGVRYTAAVWADGGRPRNAGTRAGRWRNHGRDLHAGQCRDERDISRTPRPRDKAFRGGWFASGDLGVMHPDGYIALKDRSKGHHHLGGREHLLGRGRGYPL